MKGAIVACLVALVVFVATTSHANYEYTPNEPVVVQNAVNLPDFTRPPFFLLVQDIVFPSRIHPEWPLFPLAIFITSEAKRNFIAIYYDDISIRYAEWATDTDDGVVIRGYAYIDGTFVFDKEVPR